MPEKSRGQYPFANRNLPHAHVWGKDTRCNLCGKTPKEAAEQTGIYLRGRIRPDTLKNTDE